MSDLDPQSCANPSCLDGANCPGHPWHEDELDQFRRLEAVSRDMNVAGHRGAGFRQAANFYRPQIPHNGAVLAAGSTAASALAEFHAALGDERGRGNAALRLTLHEEEHEELLDELSDKRLGIEHRDPKADEDVDREHLARELADVVYVAYGTAHAFDIDLDVAIAEVHRAAMSKLDPATMVVRGDGKIMKPPGFVSPDMSAAVR